MPNIKNIKLLNPNLIEINMEVSTRNEALKKLAQLLIKNGNAKKSYMEAILEREKKYPTGLPTEDIGVAIPHTDISHVIEPAVAISVLKKPVKFQVMSNPNEEVDVKIIFMLAIADPNEQLKLLQDLIKVFQKKELLLRIVSAENAQAIVTLLSEGKCKSFNNIK